MSLKGEAVKILPCRSRPSWPVDRDQGICCHRGFQQWTSRPGVECSEEVARAARGTVVLAKLPTIPCAVRLLGERGPKAPRCPLQGNWCCGSVLVYESLPRGALASSTPETLLLAVSSTSAPPKTGHSPVTQGHLAKTTFNTITKANSLFSPHLESGHVHSPSSRNSWTVCVGRTHSRVAVHDPGSVGAARPCTCSCLCAAAISCVDSGDT